MYFEQEASSMNNLKPTSTHIQPYQISFSFPPSSCPSKCARASKLLLIPTIRLVHQVTHMLFIQLPAVDHETADQPKSRNARIYNPHSAQTLCICTLDQASLGLIQCLYHSHTRRGLVPSKLGCKITRKRSRTRLHHVLEDDGPDNNRDACR